MTVVCFISSSSYGEILVLNASAEELFGDVRFTDFRIVFNDTGDGLLQIDEIQSFTGVTKLLEPFRNYDTILFVPKITGISTASGMINPELPCPECWEFTPGTFGADSDGWFIERWSYENESLDSDLDGILNSDDNCLLFSNSDQVDIDADGLGNACDPDFNNDCVVNFGDYALLILNFLSNNTPLFDLNNDGVVNFGDISIFTQFFLGEPGPSGLNNLCE